MSEYDPISLRWAIAELERWAAEMRLWLRPGFLPPPVITIQGGHQQAPGWFAWSRWETRDAAILDEINFVPEHLGRDVFDIAETLLHELVHLTNYAAGVKDCSSSTTAASVTGRWRSGWPWTCAGACVSAWVASGTDLHAECLACGTRFVRAQTGD
jgi:hypothetical protein